LVTVETRRRKLPPRTFACRVVGHRWTFEVEDSDLVWGCERGCGEAGRREYATPQEALRYAAALNRGGPGAGRTLAMFGGVIPRRDRDGL
jgi:hypothetical protein